MSKAAADRYQRQLLALLKEPGNDQCADCKARNPRWASWDQGVFLCVQCASMHRKLGSHITKVKSVTLDTWTKEQVDNMRRLGNVKVNSLLNPDERRNPPPPPDSGDERNGELERFIRNKYEYRVFAISPPPSPTPRAANGTSNGSSLYAPPSDPPPPILPYRPPASAAPPPPSSAFGSSFLSPPSTSAYPASSSPNLPPRPSPAVHTAPTPSPPPGPKSVRFPDLPPTIIPSDSDSEDDEIDDPYGPSTSSSAPSSRSTLKRPRAPSASLLPPRKGVLRRSAPGAASSEILVDWAAFTRDSSLSHDDEGDEDVSLASLGALGMRGAQVGMAGVYAPNGGGAMGVLPPQSHGHPQAPFAVPYGAGVGQQAMAAPAFSGGGGGGGMPAVAPLQPQYTGSAKGYLHQQREHHQQQQQQQQQPQQQGLQPQQTGTGIDAFQQMFQPPGQRGSPNPFQQQQQQQLQQQQQQQPPPQQRTNPFHAHLFDRNAYSPSPQPPQGSSSPSPQPAAPTQPQAPPAPSPTLFGTATQHAQTQKAMDDIWAGLDFLGGGGGASSSNGTAPAAPSSSFLAAPQPQQHFGGPPSASPFGSSAPSPAPQQQQAQAPAPLRPQLTGFIPSSSFGQQLARESSPFAPSPSQQQQPPALSLQIPGTPGNHASSQPPSPAPFLQPQRTGFVPSSAFGQDLAARGSSPGANGSPAPLQPQRTGFVPSSRFGMELAQEQQQQASSSAFGGLGGERPVSPAPFDIPSAPPPQQQRPNPFASMGSQMGAALPGTQQQQQQQQQQQSMLMAAGQQQAGYRGSPNPFLQPQAQRPQLTGFAGARGMAPMQQQPQQTGYGLQPQLTGFGGGGGGNPFLAFQQQQQQQGGGGGWR